MPSWFRARTAKELLAFIALVASIIGAAVLTVNRVWLIKILERAKAWTDIADIAKLDTIILGLILLSLGLAINRRSFKLTRQGIEAEGGE